MKKQENKNRRNFLLCMGGLLVLIVFAFAGPEGLLQLQDKSWLTCLLYTSPSPRD